MKTKIFLLSLALCFAAGATCFASPMMGTWKLNEAKSKFVPGASKNKMVVYSAVAGDKVKVIVDGIDGQGKPTHSEWTGKLDGKDYRVTGDPMSDTRAYTMVDDRTLDLTVKKKGKVTATGRVALSANGKTRTVTITAMDASGKKSTNKAVYDRK